MVGAEGVICVDPQVDARGGGHYRIGNRFPDGKLLWIVGEFEVVEPPHMLVYTWRLEGISETTERVTVRFEARGADTEVVVTHERILNQAARDQHQQGWLGCLDGLAEYCSFQIRPGAEAVRWSADSALTMPSLTLWLRTARESSRPLRCPIDVVLRERETMPASE